MTDTEDELTLMLEDTCSPEEAQARVNWARKQRAAMMTREEEVRFTTSSENPVLHITAETRDGRKWRMRCTLAVLSVIDTGRVDAEDAPCFELRLNVPILTEAVE